MHRLRLQITEGFIESQSELMPELDLKYYKKLQSGVNL